jgi:hypothetical protein
VSNGILPLYFNTLQRTTRPLVFCLSHTEVTVCEKCILLNECSFEQLSQCVYHRRHATKSSTKISQICRAIYNNMHNWEKLWTDSVTNKKIQKCYTLTDENLDYTGAWMETMPQKTFVLGGSQMWGVKLLSSQGNNNSKTASI